jgi:hypothetical protein
MRIIAYAGDKKYGLWWVRIFGYGLSLKAPWAKRLFSERNGYTKAITIKGWSLSYLPKMGTLATFENIHKNRENFSVGKVGEWIRTAKPITPCKHPPVGWVCNGYAGHKGPCAAHPVGFWHRLYWKIKLRSWTV